MSAAVYSGTALMNNTGMATELNDPEAFARFLHDHPAAAVYFTRAGCNVCHVLRPRLEELFAHSFPRMGLAVVDAEAAPEVAGQQRVFTVPALLVFFDGAEVVRQARAISPTGLARELQRPYALFFGD